MLPEPIQVIKNVVDHMKGVILNGDGDAGKVLSYSIIYKELSNFVKLKEAEESGTTCEDNESKRNVYCIFTGDLL